VCAPSALILESIRERRRLVGDSSQDLENYKMNGHFSLFREAMARPGTADRHGDSGAALFAAVLIGAIMLAAIIFPMISG